MILKFEKDREGDWYVNLPLYIEEGGDYEDLQMVSGADKMLDVLSDGEGEVSLEVKTFENRDDIKEPYCCKLVMDNHLTRSCHSGAIYTCFHEKGIQQVWLCPVMKWIFKSYPQQIIVNKVYDKQ